LTSRTGVDINIKHESAWQFLSENDTGDEHKKLEISWKSLTILLV